MTTAETSPLSSALSSEFSKEATTTLPKEGLPLLCQLCHRTDLDENAFGRILSDSLVTVHLSCALFASGLSQATSEDEGLHGFSPKDIAAEVRRAARLVCCFCKTKGASVGCSVAQCKKSYHLACGVDNDCVQLHFGSFPSFCPTHRPKQEAAPVAVDSAPIPCPICVEDVVPSANEFDSVWLPCCRSTNWLHRKCLQQMAYSAGRYLFKCPLCSEKKTFQKSMMTLGICIPVRDASWETSNTFNDLHREQSCYAEVCQSPEGRSFNELDTPFEIMNCDVCGSNATHLKCANLSTPLDDWACPLCVDLMKDANIEAPSGRAMLFALDDVDDAECALEAAVNDDELDAEFSFIEESIGTPKSKKRGRPRKKDSAMEQDSHSASSLNDSSKSIDSWLKSSFSSPTVPTSAKQATLDSWFRRKNSEPKPTLTEIRFVYEVGGGGAVGGGDCGKEKIDPCQTFEVSLDVKKIRGRKRNSIEMTPSRGKRRKSVTPEALTKTSSPNSFTKTIEKRPRGFFWIHVFEDTRASSGKKPRPPSIVSALPTSPFYNGDFVRARRGLEELVLRQPRVLVDVDAVEEWRRQREEQRKSELAKEKSKEKSDEMGERRSGSILDWLRR